MKEIGLEREDRIKLFIDKGYTGDLKTGYVYNRFGKRLNTIHNGYISMSCQHELERCRVFAHQFIYYLKYNKVVDIIDHINRVKDDNRIENLREATPLLNARNTIGLGYYHDKRNKKNPYQAHILIDYKKKYLGGFKTEQEAHQAYLNAKSIYHI